MILVTNPIGYILGPFPVAVAAAAGTLLLFREIRHSNGASCEDDSVVSFAPRLPHHHLLLLPVSGRRVRMKPQT